MKTSNRLRKQKPKFRVGDCVVFDIATCLFHGVISEDRGSIGVGGRRLYQIHADFGDETRVFELAEEELLSESEISVSK